MLTGCGADTQPLTQLVLVTDSDLGELDRVVFEISSEGLGSRSAEATRLGVSAPSTLSVVHDRGPLGPITVSARGLRNGNVVLQRTQHVFFVEEQTRVVELHLTASCLGVICAAAQTCAEARCVSQLLAETELPSWSGEPPRARSSTRPDAGALDGGNTLDAAVDGGDAATPEAAVRWMQCAALPAPTVDLNSDVHHCGSCSKVCKSGESCLAGTCVKK